VIGVTELEGVVQGHVAGWEIVWSGSHVTRVRSLGGVGVFEDLTPPHNLVIALMF
jgi:hypothetical protein